MPGANRPLQANPGTIDKGHMTMTTERTALSNLLDAIISADLWQELEAGENGEGPVIQALQAINKPIPKSIQIFMADSDESEVDRILKTGQHMDNAPRDGSTIRVMTDNFHIFPVKWADGFMDEDENECGSWIATTDDYPDCWSDGAYWTCNADEHPSAPPILWEPMELEA